MFKVWIQGYITSGERAVATCLGEFNGDSFSDACKVAVINKGWDISYYNEVNNTYWGCSFF